MSILIKNNNPAFEMTVLILTPLPLEYDAASPYLTGKRETMIEEAAAYEVGNFVGKYHTYAVVVRERLFNCKL